MYICTSYIFALVSASNCYMEHPCISVYLANTKVSLGLQTGKFRGDFRFSQYCCLHFKGLPEKESFWTAWPWRWRQYDPSKCCELLTHWLGITSQKTWIFRVNSYCIIKFYKGYQHNFIKVWLNDMHGHMISQKQTVWFPLFHTMPASNNEYSVYLLFLT